RHVSSAINLTSTNLAAVTESVNAFAIGILVPTSTSFSYLGTLDLPASQNTQIVNSSNIVIMGSGGSLDVTLVTQTATATNRLYSNSWGQVFGLFNPNTPAVHTSFSLTGNLPSNSAIYELNFDTLGSVAEYFQGDIVPGQISSDLSY